MAVRKVIPILAVISSKGFIMKSKAARLLIGGAALSLMASGLFSSTFAQPPVVYSSPEYAQPSVQSYAEPTPEELLKEYDDPAKTLHLTVVVNDKAVVTINGEPTYTKGTVRQYVAKRLQPGKFYVFNIEALMKNEHGAEFSASESVTIEAGATKQVVLKVHRTKRQPAPVQPSVPASNVTPAANPASNSGQAK
jgi:uncharacterized protein (TIGR03000 family)